MAVALAALICIAYDEWRCVPKRGRRRKAQKTSQKSRKLFAFCANKNSLGSTTDLQTLSSVFDSRKQIFEICRVETHIKAARRLSHGYSLLRHKGRACFQAINCINNLSLYFNAFLRGNNYFSCFIARKIKRLKSPLARSSYHHLYKNHLICKRSSNLFHFQFA